MPEAEDRQALAGYFAAVDAALHRDIVAMRDSIEPTRFDEPALDRAEAAFERADDALREGFSALADAVNVND